MNRKNAVKLSILAMALVQMGTNGIAPALSGIAAAFPAVSPSVVQYLMTFPSLIVVCVSLCAPGLSAKIPKKILTAIGCVLTALGGCLAAMFHSHFPLLFVWAGMIGVGIGMISGCEEQERWTNRDKSAGCPLISSLRLFPCQWKISNKFLAMIQF